MKAIVIIERGTDGFYSAYMDDDRFDFGLNGQGNTVLEAKDDFLKALQEIREMKLDEGTVMPNLEFEFEYDVDSFLNYYSGVLSKSGLEKITGINQKQLWHYASGKRKPTKQTILKIQNGLHNFAKDLMQVHFVD